MTLTLPELAKKMQKIDFCMMITKSEFGAIASRPMSNNGEVDYDGDSYFFSYTDTRKVRELEADPNVTLDFQSKDTWISVRGQARLHRDDRALFEAHWTKDLDRWFEQGIDTPGLTLIEVVAEVAEVNGRPGEGTVDLRS